MGLKMWNVRSELKNVFHRLHFFQNLPIQDMNDTNAAPATETASGVPSSWHILKLVTSEAAFKSGVAFATDDPWKH